MKFLYKDWDLGFNGHGSFGNYVFNYVKASESLDDLYSSQGTSSNIQHETLVDLLVALRMDFPEAMILGLSAIGSYYIKVSEKMNQLRMELAEKP